MMSGFLCRSFHVVVEKAASASVLPPLWLWDWGARL